MPEDIILPSDPRAAAPYTLNGWRSRNGFFYAGGESDEEIARWEGATHVPCRLCGEPSVKPYTACGACRLKKEPAWLAAEEGPGAAGGMGMSADFRALVAELADALDHDRQCLFDDSTATHPLATRARAVLAALAPVVGAPSDEAWQEFIEQLQRVQHVALGEGQGPRFDLVEFALAAWRTTPAPVPSDALQRFIDEQRPLSPEAAQALSPETRWELYEGTTPAPVVDDDTLTLAYAKAAASFIDQSASLIDEATLRRAQAHALRAVLARFGSTTPAPVPVSERKGLHDKYTIHRNRDGSPVDFPAFVLRADGTDPAAIAALQAYASDPSCPPELAGDLVDRFGTTPAPVPVPVALDAYHEDMGPVTWWTFPVEEPPWVGTPNDSDWPGYHTHFTPCPAVPADPAHALPLPEVEGIDA